MNDLWEIETAPPCAERWIPLVMAKARKQYGNGDLRLNRIFMLSNREHFFLFCTGRHGRAVFFHVARDGVSRPNWPDDAKPGDRIPIPRLAKWAMFPPSHLSHTLLPGERSALRDRVVNAELRTREPEY